MTKITVDKAAMQQALDAHRAMREWINAVPDDTPLPAMPGVSGDWLDEVEFTLVTALAEPEVDLVRKLFLQQGVFPDLVGFDANGLPCFYSKESVDKFRIGQSSTPCKGENCGSMNGWMHSIECHAEHELHFTSPPPPAEVPLLTDAEIGQCVQPFVKAALDSGVWDYAHFARAIEALVLQKAGLK